MFNATELEIKTPIRLIRIPRILPVMLMAIRAAHANMLLPAMTVIQQLVCPKGSSTRDRRLTLSSVVLHSPQNLQFLTLNVRGGDLYLPGSKIHLQFQAQNTTAFRPLVAKIVKRLEPFTSSVVLLIQQISDSKQFILKLNDRRLGHRHRLNMEDGELPWTPALEERLRAAVRDIQLGKVTNWFEFVKDTMNPARPHPDDWEDWMWEMSTWAIRMQEHQNEVDTFRLLRRLQGHLIPRYYGLVHLPISPSEPLHPITDYVPGCVIEYIQGVSMGSLQPGVDIPRPEVEAIADRVMDGFRTIKAEQSRRRKQSCLRMEYENLLESNADGDISTNPAK
ncbi:hypothetical protein EV421DRAFT_2024756 [Armillaria borealis]|uniref:Uncharacterized protein n=1 Tax=Armillaria borealis TaxID=47425 RepID=A0AA39IV66_9AGAR|nr:hypothetical protein EV421DRAFT_2024756 [Armillaria borealis]